MEPNDVVDDASLLNEVARDPRRSRRTASFFLALFLLCASTLMYEVVGGFLVLLGFCLCFNGDVRHDGWRAHGPIAP
jgi:hypothetical protein